MGGYFISTLNPGNSDVRIIWIVKEFYALAAGPVSENRTRLVTGDR